MPYVQQPKELLQHSQDTLRRVNQTDLNIRGRIIAQDDKAMAYQQAHTLINAQKGLALATNQEEAQRYVDRLNMSLPDTDDGKVLIANAFEDIILSELGKEDSSNLEAIESLLPYVIKEEEHDPVDNRVGEPQYIDVPSSSGNTDYSIEPSNEDVRL